jgi:hypothetical protein
MDFAGMVSAVSLRLECMNQSVQANLHDIYALQAVSDLTVFLPAR